MYPILLAEMQAHRAHYLSSFNSETAMTPSKPSPYLTNHSPPRPAQITLAAFLSRKAEIIRDSLLIQYIFYRLLHFNLFQAVILVVPSRTETSACKFFFMSDIRTYTSNARLSSLQISVFRQLRKDATRLPLNSSPSTLASLSLSGEAALALSAASDPCCADSNTLLR